MVTSKRTIIGEGWSEAHCNHPHITRTHDNVHPNFSAEILGLLSAGVQQNLRHLYLVHPIDGQIWVEQVRVSDYDKSIVTNWNFLTSDSDTEELPDPSTPPLRMRLYCSDEEKRKLLCNMFASDSDNNSSDVVAGPSKSEDKLWESPTRSAKRKRAETSTWCWNVLKQRKMFQIWENETVFWVYIFWTISCAVERNAFFAKCRRKPTVTIVL